jgi:hypothetical protein
VLAAPAALTAPSPATNLQGTTIIIDCGDDIKHKLRADTEGEAENWITGLKTMVVDDDEVEEDKGGKPYPADKESTTWVSVTLGKGEGLVAKDAGGVSDPYVKLCVIEPGAKKGKMELLGKSTVKKKTVNPNWNNEEVGYFIEQGSEVVLQVYDYDSQGKHEFMGMLQWTWDQVKDGSEAKLSEHKLLDREGSAMGKDRGMITLAINVAGTELGDTVDTHLPEPLTAGMLEHLHRAAFHANANTAHGSHYPYTAVVDHIACGFKVSRRVSDTDETFATKQEISEFCWLIFYKSVEKGLHFVSGSWLVWDPDWKFQNGIAALSYSRKFGKPWNKKLDAVYSKSSFGSTHYIDYCMFKDKFGLWAMPDNKVEYALEKEGKSFAYYQTGIDIDDKHNSDNSITMGLFCEKAHIVCGKIPPKRDGDHWTFIKAEHFGTQNTSDQIGHTAQLGKSVTGASKGPKHLRGEKRVENVDKKKLKSFLSIMESMNSLRVRLLDTELNEDEQEERAKGEGMSFMYRCISEILVKSLEYSAAVQDDKNVEPREKTTVEMLVKKCEKFVRLVDRYWLRACCTARAALRLLCSVSMRLSDNYPPPPPRARAHAPVLRLCFRSSPACSDPGLDHLEARFGGEVILDHDELFFIMPQ